MVLKWNMYRKLMQNDTICPRIVASAAPRIPMSNVKMKIGSRIVFTMAPISMEIIE